MRSAVALLVAACALACVSVQGQAPIPYRLDGYEVATPLGFAPISMDIFVDLLCPDCAEAWPNVLALIDHYGDNISVNAHTFPLPYHTNGFMVAQAGQTVLKAQAAAAAAAGTSSVKAWIQFITWMFNNQAAFWNPATENQGSVATLAQLQTAIVNAGFITAAAFTAGFNDQTNDETRVSWKYACSRGVLGTPTYLINGVNVNGDPAWTVADWQQVLDPLLAPAPAMKKKPTAVVAPKCHTRSFSSRMFGKHATDCPVGKPACAYLPGKVECCTPGERCIPNVGCRC